MTLVHVELETLRRGDDICGECDALCLRTVPRGVAAAPLHETVSVAIVVKGIPLPGPDARSDVA